MSAWLDVLTLLGPGPVCAPCAKGEVAPPRAKGEAAAPAEVKGDADATPPLAKGD